jgi:hypothetical protein
MEATVGSLKKARASLFSGVVSPSNLAASLLLRWDLNAASELLVIT